MAPSVRPTAGFCGIPAVSAQVEAQKPHTRLHSTKRRNGIVPARRHRPVALGRGDLAATGLVGPRYAVAFQLDVVGRKPVPPTPICSRGPRPALDIDGFGIVCRIPERPARGRHGRQMGRPPPRDTRSRPCRSGVAGGSVPRTGLGMVTAGHRDSVGRRVGPRLGVEGGGLKWAERCAGHNDGKLAGILAEVASPDAGDRTRGPRGSNVTLGPPEEAPGTRWPPSLADCWGSSATDRKTLLAAVRILREFGPCGIGRLGGTAGGRRFPRWVADYQRYSVTLGLAGVRASMPRLTMKVVGVAPALSTRRGRLCVGQPGGQTGGNLGRRTSRHLRPQRPKSAKRGGLPPTRCAGRRRAGRAAPPPRTGSDFFLGRSPF